MYFFPTFMPIVLMTYLGITDAMCDQRNIDKISDKLVARSNYDNLGNLISEVSQPVDRQDCEHRKTFWQTCSINQNHARRPVYFYLAWVFQDQRLFKYRLVVCKTYFDG